MKTKKEWRAHFLSQRLALTMAERECKSKQLADRYLSIFEKERPAVVHLFLPMTSKAEIDTWLILKAINEKYPSVKTVTSVIAEDQQSLETIEVRIDSPLLVTEWGIPEPVTRIHFPTKAIEEVLTPLLASDHRGYRLGYGKGFYDRFFESCSASVKRTGLNFFPDVKEELPNDAWDVKLHRLIYPDGIVDFSK